MGVTDLASLDNPIWSALTTEHQSLARTNGLARRYPNDVSPLAALAKPTPKAFADMSALVEPNQAVALFTSDPVEVPGGWQVKRTGWMQQMVCDAATASPAVGLHALRDADIPEMLALTAATEPGPFLPRTIEMGRYFGIRSADGRLIAMAGERLRLDGFTEVSAVCTHPEFRGRGYGHALVSSVAARILQESRVPILHVFTENGAISVYKKVGFRVRRALCLTVIARE
jgi:predicted GNAT family acetyltransferase